MDIKGWVRAHRVLVTTVAVTLTGLAVFAVVWFQPQKLFLNDRVNEAAPTVPIPPTGTAQPTGTASPAALPSGLFRSLEHDTTGRARIVRSGNGLALRFEDLKTTNGPDLVVFLSRKPAGLGWRDYGSGFILLGKLKGNVGNQNYAIPAGTDLSMFHSAVIWCRRFKVGFGVAPLA